jgi:outer membrane protein OmpA-like peptidoglycan-associated protein
MGDASLHGDDPAGDAASGTNGGRKTRAGKGGRGVAGAGGADENGLSSGAGGGTMAGVGGAGRGGDALGGVSGRGAAGAGGRGSRGVPGAGGEDDPMIVGMVDAPSGRARVDEDVTPQTLGGMLPLVVGVDEQGQFDFDRAVLRVDVKVVLDGLAVKLQDAEYDRLDIIGYSDRIGSDEYNQQLSERRAWAVARYLMQQGVPLAKIRVEGRGERESMLAATECADLVREQMSTCLQQDRRVQIEASIRKTHMKIE